MHGASSSIDELLHEFLLWLLLACALVLAVLFFVPGASKWLFLERSVGDVMWVIGGIFWIGVLGLGFWAIPRLKHPALSRRQARLREFGRVGGQPFEREPVAVSREVFLHDPAAVRRQTIPEQDRPRAPEVATTQVPAPAVAPLLVLESVDTVYGHAQILNGLSLHIGVGETVAVLERNGLGKTTAIKSILGLVPVRRGRILFGASRSWTASSTAPESTSALSLAHRAYVIDDDRVVHSSKAAELEASPELRSKTPG